MLRKRCSLYPTLNTPCQPSVAIATPTTQRSVRRRRRPVPVAALVACSAGWRCTASDRQRKENKNQHSAVRAGVDAVDVSLLKVRCLWQATQVVADIKLLLTAATPTTTLTGNARSDRSSSSLCRSRRPTCATVDSQPDFRSTWYRVVTSWYACAVVVWKYCRQTWATRLERHVVCTASSSYRCTWTRTASQCGTTHCSNASSSRRPPRDFGGAACRSMRCGG